MTFKKIIIIFGLAFGLIFLIEMGNRDQTILTSLLDDYREEEVLDFLSKSGQKGRKTKLDLEDWAWAYKKLGHYDSLEELYLGAIEDSDQDQAGPDYEDRLLDLYLDKNLEKLGGYLDQLIKEEDSYRLYGYYRGRGLEIPEEVLELLRRKKDYDYLLDYYVARNELSRAGELVLEGELAYRDSYNNYLERLDSGRIIGLLARMKEEGLDYGPVLDRFEELEAGKTYGLNLSTNYGGQRQGEAIDLLKILDFYRDQGLDPEAYLEGLDLEEDLLPIVDQHLAGSILGQSQELLDLDLDREEFTLLLTSLEDSSQLYFFNGEGELDHTSSYRGSYLTRPYLKGDLFVGGELGYLLIEDGKLGLLVLYQDGDRPGEFLVRLSDDLIRGPASISSQKLAKSVAIEGLSQGLEIRTGIRDNIFIVEEFYDQELGKSLGLVLREYRILESGYLELVDLRRLGGWD